MKIIGNTDAGYLAQISETEIGIILGYGRCPTYGESKEPFLSATNRVREDQKIPTNTELDVRKGFDYLAELKEKTISAEKCARSLREIADLITNNLPNVVIPPQEV